jgi:hypothetical protein
MSVDFASLPVHQSGANSYSNCSPRCIEASSSWRFTDGTARYRSAGREWQGQPL